MCVFVFSWRVDPCLTVQYCFEDAYSLNQIYRPQTPHHKSLLKWFQIAIRQVILQFPHLPLLPQAREFEGDFAQVPPAREKSLRQPCQWAVLFVFLGRWPGSLSKWKPDLIFPFFFLFLAGNRGTWDQWVAGLHCLSWPIRWSPCDKWRKGQWDTKTLPWLLMWKEA